MDVHAESWQEHPEWSEPEETAPCALGWEVGRLDPGEGKEMGGAGLYLVVGMVR